MPAVAKRTTYATRTQLPREIVPLDPQIVASYGITYAWVGTDQLRAYLTGDDLSRLGSPTLYVDSAAGLAAATVPSQGNSILLGPAERLLPTDNCTIIVYRRCTDTTARQSTLVSWFGTALYGTNRVAVHAPWSDGICYFDFGTGTSTSGRVTAGYVKDTEPEVLAFVASSSASVGRQIWRRGAMIGSNTAATMTRPAAAAGEQFAIGTAYTNGEVDGVEYYYVLICDKALSAQQIVDISDNPALVFEPVARRTWVSAPAVPTVIAATTGTAAGAGTTASISARTIIAASAGTASGQGTTANVAARTRIDASVGTAAGTGTTATIAEHTTIAATAGHGAGVGTQATLTQRTVISATAPGTAAGVGHTAQIAEHTAIAAGVGTAAGDGTTATITAGGKILATVGVARGEGTTATIRTPDRIAATVGTAQGAGTQATIAERTRIAAGVGTGEGRGSTAQIVMPTRIAANAGTAEGRGTTATVAEHTRIAATVGEGAGVGTTAIIEVLMAGGGGATAAQIWARLMPHGMTAQQTMAELHALLTELHQVHGLRAGVPLVVSPAERRAGGVVQSIAESGGVVTMERAA